MITKSISYQNLEYNSIYKENIYDFISEELKLQVKKNDKLLINDLELDIFIPSKNLGLTFCELYFNSDKFLEKNIIR